MHREVCSKKTQPTRYGLVPGSVSGQCLVLESIFELVVLFLSRAAGGCGRYFYSIELNITPKSEKWYLGSYTECPKSEIWASSS